MPDRDPRGLRSAVLLATVVAFAWSLGPNGGTVSDAWRGRAMGVSTAPRIDAWVTPPGYTGRAPIYLTAFSAEERAAIAVPAGSILTARASGGSGTFGLELRSNGQAVSVAEEASGENQLRSAAAQQFVVTLDRDVEAVLLDDGDAARSWAFTIVPDQPPRIRFSKDPTQALNGTLELSFEVEDDYGIASAMAEFTLIEPVAEGAIPLYGPPDFPLSSPRRGRQAAEVRRDLTAHPWAGAAVSLRLRAEDDAGQTGLSEPREFLLPERSFSHPLARAVVEQRRILALDANARRRVLDMLEALLLWPEETIANATHFLALRVAQRQLQQARTEEHLREVAEYLWEVALGIEQGDLSAAERRLLQAQENLQKALEEGASDEEIEQLMAELREAMQEFLRELAQRAMQNPDMAAPMPQDAMPMTQSDLERMLDQIEELAKSGARDQARELLSQLQDMMNNLQAMRQGQQQGGAQDAMRQQMDQLGDIMRRQQELMNETFRMDQQRRNQPGQRGEQGTMSPEEFAEALRQLQEGQSQLQNDLNQLMESLGELGIEPGAGFGEAGEHMGNAGKALGQGEGEQAVGEQGEALQALRRGAQDMMNQMQQQAGEGPGAREGRSGGDGRDPLGRPRATNGPDFGDNVDVPDEIDVQRARRILEAIRKRLGDALSPAMEREYLERLLELR